MSKSKRATPTDARDQSTVPPERLIHSDLPDHMADDTGIEDLADANAEETLASDDFSEISQDAEGIADDGVTPSWFGNGLSPDDSAALASRYRAARAHAPLFEQPGPEAYDAYRRRLEERFQSAKRMASGPVAPFSTMPEDRAQKRKLPDDDGNLRFREWQRKMNARQQPAVEAEGRSRLTPLRIAGLFAVACSIGGAAGLASANMGLVRSAYTSVAGTASASMSALLALMPSPSQSTPTEQAATGGGSTVLTKKPVRMARVDVADVSGGLNNPIPLALNAVPAEPDMPLALKITGLPGDAYLTKGTQVADGAWLLKPADIKGVELVVPQAQSPQLDLAVAAVEEKTGVEAAPPREMTVELDLGNVTVQPANAPPEVQSNGAPTLPQAIPLPQEADIALASSEAKTLLGKGEALLKTGDLVSARQFFIKAHAKGLAEGAYGAGQTYDPAVYADMNVRGLEPDAEMAREWYGKAASAGHSPASEALEKLNAAAP